MAQMRGLYAILMAQALLLLLELELEDEDSCFFFLCFDDFFFDDEDVFSVLTSSYGNSSNATGGIRTLGALFKCSLKSSVRAPRPIDVKKLIEKRVLRGLSRGNRPWKNSCNVGSAKRSFVLTMPMCSLRSRRRFFK